MSDFGPPKTPFLKETEYLARLTKQDETIISLGNMVAELQASNSKLWHERNAAIEGGWPAIKSLYASEQAKENDRLRTENARLKGKLAALGQ